MTTRYTIRAYAGPAHQALPPLALALVTKHETEVSRDIEVEAYRGRARRGEIAYVEILDHEAAITDTIYFTGGMTP